MVIPNTFQYSATWFPRRSPHFDTSMSLPSFPAAPDDGLRKFLGLFGGTPVFIHFTRNFQYTKRKYIEFPHGWSLVDDFPITFCKCLHNEIESHHAIKWKTHYFNVSMAMFNGSVTVTTRGYGPSYFGIPPLMETSRWISWCHFKQDWYLLSQHTRDAWIATIQDQICGGTGRTVLQEKLRWKLLPLHYSIDHKLYIYIYRTCTKYIAYIYIYIVYSIYVIYHIYYMVYIL